MTSLDTSREREPLNRIMAIAGHHDQQIILALPVSDQIAICERIILTHPCRHVQKWARSRYLDLTKGDLSA